MDIIFDKKRIRQLRQMATTQQSNGLPQVDFLIQHSAAALMDRLRDIRRSFKTVLLIGFFPELPELQENFDHVVRFDLGQRANLDIEGDAEYLPFADHSFDLVMVNLALHHLNDLPGALIQIKQTLKADGLFLGCLFGEETLLELRQSLLNTDIALNGGAAPRIIPMVDMRDIGGLMQRAGFALPVIDKERVHVTYPDALKLMHELQQMGESNPLLKQSRKPPVREFFPRVCHHYAQNYSEQSGRIYANFDIIYLCGWHPHESQQKPLKPGSAKISLHEVLS